MINSGNYLQYNFINNHKMRAMLFIFQLPFPPSPRIICPFKNHRESISHVFFKFNIASGNRK